MCRIILAALFVRSPSEGPGDSKTDQIIHILGRSYPAAVIEHVLTGSFATNYLVNG